MTREDKVKRNKRLKRLILAKAKEDKAKREQSEAGDAQGV